MSPRTKVPTTIYLPILLSKNADNGAMRENMPIIAQVVRSGKKDKVHIIV